MSLTRELSRTYGPPLGFLSVNRVLALLSATVFLLTACSDGSPPARAGYVQGTAEALRNAAAAEDVNFADGEAECLADAVVDAIGVDSLAAADVSSEDLVAAEALIDLPIDLRADATDALRSAVPNCGVDFAELLVGEVTSQFGEDAIAPDAVDCIATSVAANASVNEAFVESLITGQSPGNGAPYVEASQAAFTECPAAFADLFVAGLEQTGRPVSDEAEVCLDQQISQLDVTQIQFVVAQSSEGAEIARGMIAACSAELGVG